MNFSRSVFRVLMCFAFLMLASLGFSQDSEGGEDSSFGFDSEGGGDSGHH